jgi:hypothetical protein
VVPVHIAIVVEQVAEPGVATDVLGSTPEESVDPNIAETTTETTTEIIAITTWES